MELLASRLAARLIDVILLVVLARTLSPRDFGLVAVATALIGFIDVVRDLGLEQAAIFSKTFARVERSTLWWSSLALGALLAAGLMVAATPLTGVIGSPESADLLIVLSLALPMSSATLAPAVVLRRRLDFGRLATASTFGSVLSALVALALVTVEPSPWVLVARTLTQSAAICVLTITFARFVPRFEFDASYVRSLVRFGLPVAGARVLETVQSYGDDLVVSRFYGPGSLGVYSVAYRLFKLMTQTFVGVVAQVSAPVFAQVADDHDRVLRLYYQSISATSLVGIPMFAGIGAAAPWLIPLIFGDQWGAAIPIMQVLTIVGVAQCIRYFDAQLLYAMSMPRLALGLRFMSVACTFAAFFVVALNGWSLVAFAAAYAMSMWFVAAPLWLITLRRVAGISLRVVARVTAPSIMGSMLVVLVILVGASFGTWGRVSGVVVAIATYYVTIRLLAPAQLRAVMGPAAAAVKRRRPASAR